MRQRQIAKRKAAADPRAGFDLKAYRWWILAAILVIAAFLRLNQLGSAPAGLNHDVAMNGNNALENIETRRMALYYPENTGREGLFINVQTASVAVLGNTAFALRLPAAIFGLLTVWAVYCLGVEWFSLPIGLTAAFFAATSFWHLVFSRAGLRAVSAPCFLVWSLYLLCLGLRRGRAGVTGAAGLLYGLGFHTYIAYRVTPLLIAVVLWYEFRRSRDWKGMAVFVAGAVIAAAPLAAYFVSHPGSFGQRTVSLSVFQTAHPAQELFTNVWKTAAMFLFAGDPNFGHNYASRPELFWPVAIFFAIGVVVAAWRRSATNVFLLVWMGVGLLPAVLSHDTMPHALRSILVIPAVFLLAAIGAGVAASWLAGRTPGYVRVAGPAVLAVVLIAEPYRVYFDLWSVHPEVTKWSNVALAGIADQLNAMPVEQPKYVAVNILRAQLLNAVPVQAMTIMFLTRTYTPPDQKRLNIHYVSPMNFPTLPGRDFCQSVSRHIPPDAALVCVQ